MVRARLSELINDESKLAVAMNGFQGIQMMSLALDKMYGGNQDELSTASNSGKPAAK